MVGKLTQKSTQVEVESSPAKLVVKVESKKKTFT